MKNLTAKLPIFLAFLLLLSLFVGFRSMAASDTVEDAKEKCTDL